MSPDCVSRRTILTATSSISALALAGCSLPNESEPDFPAVSVQNSIDQTVTISLEISNAESRDVVVDDEFSLRPDEEREYEQLFTTAGKKSVTVRLESGASKEYSWETNPELGGSTLSILITEGRDIHISLIAR